MQQFHQKIQPDYEFYWHFRENPKKQATLCVMFKGSTASISVARCSENDQYCKKTGRLIARGRAKKELYGAPGTLDSKFDWERAYQEAAKVAEKIRIDLLQ